MPVIKALLRPLSAVLFAAAAIALALLLSSDAGQHFEPTAYHQKIGAFALMLVGASFICLQPNTAAGLKEKTKAVLLGLAFVLWGGEQFLPAGACATAVDSAVISIFVVDLGLVILGLLRRKDGDKAPSLSKDPRSSP